MVQVNDTVLYGGQSVCTVTEICERKVGKEKLLYYALKPVFDGKSTIYVPCANEKLVGKMRRILSAAEIRALIDSLQSDTLDWVENDADRKAQYGEILQQGDRRTIALLIRTLFLRREALKASGRKFHAADEQILERAQKLLHEEFAYVLHIRPEEVPLFITHRLEAAEKESV